MFCKNCGSQIDDSVEFCPVCGAKVEAAPAGTTVVVQEEAKESGKSVLTWGIVAAVLCETGLLGLIFAIIAKSKVKKHLRAGYPLNGQAKAGKICANIALPVSIVMMVIILAYIFIFAAILAAGGAASSEFWSAFREAYGPY